MWTVDEPFQAAWSEEPISPKDILYEFDGPLTFTTQFGFFDALFHKIGDRRGSQFFLACEASPEKVEALKTGALSIRGALDSKKYWIVELSSSLQVKRYWSCSCADLPQKFLPKSGLPIHAIYPVCADSIEQAEAFFAINFKGEELRCDGMPFSLLRSLTNNAYEAARKILSPAFLVGAKSATYDFKVRPALGSLILALGTPEVNAKRLRERTIAAPVPLEKVQGYFDAQNEHFFDEMDDLVKITQKGEISLSYAAEKFSLLDNIHSIVPSGEGRIDSVEFTSTARAEFRNLYVGENAGSKIYAAFRQAEERPITETGIVEQVNWKKFWFVYSSPRGNQVKCWSYEEDFQFFINDERLRRGTVVKVHGKLHRRPRRDQIQAVTVPEIIRVP